MKKIFLLLIVFIIVSASLYAGGQREEPQLFVTASGTQYISPDDNKISDSAEMKFRVDLYVKSKTGYVPEYGVRILDASGSVVKEIMQKEKSDIGWFARLFTKYSKFTLEKSITWDGKNTAGTVVPEGIYGARIWIRDSAAITREADLDKYVVDITEPEVTLNRQENLKFSPDNDGALDFFEIMHIGAGTENIWTGEFYSEDGKSVKKYEWQGTLPEVFPWDGKDESGNILEDGVYSYRLNCTDLAGNTMPEKTIEGIIIDTRNPEIVFNLSELYISPNGDGVRDFSVLTFGQNDPEGLLEWKITMADASSDSIDGNVLYSGTEPGIFEAVFDGKDSAGNAVPDGKYNIGFIGIYDNGARITRNGLLYIDRTAPSVSVDIANRIFSPGNTDGKGNAEIKFKSDKIVTWNGSIQDAGGASVIEVSDSDTTSLIVWDGRNSAGNEMPDGDYFLSAVFTDVAGNSTEISGEKITIRRNAGSAEILVIPGAVRRSEGKDSSGLYFKVVSESEDEVASWSFALIKENGDTEGSGEMAASFSGEGSLPDHIFWDGKEAAAEGFYTAVFTVMYANGAKLEKRIENVFHDLTPPLIDVAISTSPFIDAGGSFEGEVEIIIEVKELHGYYDWEVVIADKDDNVIMSYSGEGEPESYVIWYGETENNYQLKPDSVLNVIVKVTDMAGNADSVKTDIPFNVPIEKRGSKYYIKTDDVIFPAYKSGIASGSRQQTGINMDSIAKVAEFHKSYPFYTILIEGHALNVLLGSGSAREIREEKILEKVTYERAMNVKKELIKLGVPEEKLQVKAFGGKEPVAPVRDLKERWKNRRVVFSLEF